jgi:hypothetical protein
MVDSWSDLRGELTREARPGWTIEQLKKAANLSGLRLEDRAGSRLDALGRANWGSFGGLADSEHVGLEYEAVRAWARARLIEQIDAEVAGLKAHYETLDFASIEQDRAEAGDRALFDPSKEAALARRYESEARRGFFKALDQFRQVETEAAERDQFVSTATSEPTPLASSRETERMTVREPRPAPSQGARPARTEEMVAHQPRNRPEAAGRTAIKVG